MVDEVYGQLIGLGSIQRERIPMLFVHMISRCYHRKIITQSKGILGIAFQVDLQRDFVFLDKDEHLSPEFIHQGARTKRIFCESPFEGLAVFTDIPQRNHALSFSPSQGNPSSV